MWESAFTDVSEQPTKKDLQSVLGETFKYWDGLKKYLAEEYEVTGDEWSYYKKGGWSFIPVRKKRRIVYMLPCDGFFVASFVYGEKAVKVVNESSLPADIKEQLENAPKWGEGRPLRIEVKSGSDFDNIKSLAVIKIKN